MIKEKKIAALSVLIIQGVLHLGHLKVYHKTDANRILVFLAFIFEYLMRFFTHRKVTKQCTM